MLAGMRSSLAVVCVVVLAGCGGRVVGASEEGASDEGTSGVTTLDVPTSDDDDDADTSDGSPPDLGQFPCGGFTIAPGEAIPANVVIVVDTSASMASRWVSARSFLEQFVAEIDGDYSLGLQRAPSSDADVCLVEPAPEIGVGELHGEQILAALPEASSLELAGGSPLAAAIISARDHLLEQESRSPSFIVLVTDGGANCAEPSLPEAIESFDENLVGLVSDIYNLDQIYTLVVGVDVAEQPSLPALPDSPAVDTFAALNDIALAGGVPAGDGVGPRKFFQVDEVDDVVDGFVLFEDDPTCVIDLTMLEEGPPDPVQIPYVTIEMNGADVPYVLDCENEDGWTWIEAGLVLSFCGSHCDAYMTEGVVVDGFYGCGGSP